MRVSPVAARSTFCTILLSTWAGPMCARSSQSVAILSGMTFRDRNDKRVLMQNLRSWYLISGSAQTRIWSMSLQIVPHLFRTYSRT